MKSNIIRAIINLVEEFNIEINEVKDINNRANSMGEGLENYIKDLFIDLKNPTEIEKVKARAEIFSYSGNRNNPPDAILKNGDAIEVKKIETLKSSLALNSSYPKNKLYSNSSMITKACRDCEEWTEKDILYCVGTVKTKKLKHLMMIYGNDYAADKDVYCKIKKKITEAIENNSDLDFAKTNELAKINKVDPLEITSFRIRGMWSIVNPVRVFSYIYEPYETKDFQFVAIINDEKYKTLEFTDELENLNQLNEDLNILNIEIKDPNNPVKFKNAKLIRFTK